MSFKRDEILKKARQSKKDERMESVMLHGHRWSLFFIHVVLGILIFLRLQRDEPVLDLLLISNVSLASYNTYIFIKMREKYEYLVGALILIPLIIALLRRLFINYGVL